MTAFFTVKLERNVGNVLLASQQEVIREQENKFHLNFLFICYYLFTSQSLSGATNPPQGSVLGEEGRLLTRVEEN